MPVLSSLFLISTTLHTLPVAEGQEEERSEVKVHRAIFVLLNFLLLTHLSNQVSRSYVSSYLLRSQAVAD